MTPKKDTYPTQSLAPLSHKPLSNTISIIINDYSFISNARGWNSLLAPPLIPVYQLFIRINYQFRLFRLVFFLFLKNPIVLILIIFFLNSKYLVLFNLVVCVGFGLLIWNSIQINCELMHVDLLSVRYQQLFATVGLPWWLHWSICCNRRLNWLNSIVPISISISVSVTIHCNISIDQWERMANLLSPGRYVALSSPPPSNETD